MNPGEEISRQFYSGGVALIETDIRLGFTFLDFAVLEFHLQDEVHGTRSLFHARAAAQGATRMLKGLPALNLPARQTLEQRIGELSKAADLVEARQATRHNGLPLNAND